MSCQDFVISTVDYSRLEPMIRDAVARGTIAREQLSFLKSHLVNARIVEPSEMPQGVVTMNSTVRFRDLDTGEVETYTLVYPGFADISENRLSILSPFGMAILGCREGDTVELIRRQARAAGHDREGRVSAGKRRPVRYLTRFAVNRRPLADFHQRQDCAVLPKHVSERESR